MNQESGGNNCKLQPFFEQLFALRCSKRHTPHSHRQDDTNTAACNNTIVSAATHKTVQEKKQKRGRVIVTKQSQITDGKCFICKQKNKIHASANNT